MNVSDRTRKQYASKMRILADYLAKKDPDIVVGGKIDLTMLTPKHFTLFLAEKQETCGLSALSVRRRPLAPPLELIFLSPLPC